MKKLIAGIVDFRKRVLPEYRATSAKLALGQAPDAMLITCSDSRVAPNVFASTNPGDLFVVRNVGNMVSPCNAKGVSVADESEAAAIEFASEILNVRDIIVCGHSECGAIQALIRGRQNVESPNLRGWLRHAEPIFQIDPNTLLSEMPAQSHNVLSQLNVLQQLQHVKSYPTVQKRLKENTLRVHAWWFELLTGNVYVYEEAKKRFTVIDEHWAEKSLPNLTV